MLLAGTRAETAPYVTHRMRFLHPIKKQHTKTHTTQKVCGVRFVCECRRYADILKSEGIQNPGGYATKIYRSGEADELIDSFSPAVL